MHTGVKCHQSYSNNSKFFSNWDINKDFYYFYLILHVNSVNEKYIIKYFLFVSEIRGMKKFERYKKYTLKSKNNRN